MSEMDRERWLNIAAFQVRLAKARVDADELAKEVDDLPDAGQIYKLAAATEGVLRQLDAALESYLESK